MVRALGSMAAVTALLVLGFATPALAASPSPKPGQVGTTDLSNGTPVTQSAALPFAVALGIGVVVLVAFFAVMIFIDNKRHGKVENRPRVRRLG